MGENIYILYTDRRLLSRRRREFLQLNNPKNQTD